jgi:acetyltransferase
VVLIKAGRSLTTARAAKAHTGALVGEERVFDAVLQELGVIRVDSVDELIDVALMLVANHARRPAGPGVGIVSFGGGSGVLAADQCMQHGLATPSLSAEGSARLRPLLVSVASAANPLDLTPTTAFRAEALARLPEALDVMAAEPAVDSLLFIASSMAARAAEISELVSSLSRRSAKPVCITWSSPPAGVIERLAEDSIYTFTEPDRALRALRRLVAHARALRRPPRPAPPGLETFDWFSQVPEPLVVPEHRCHEILKAAGLPVAAGTLVRKEADLPRALEAIGLPVALKGISAAVTHRAAAGLLALDVRSEEEALAAFRRLDARAGEIPVELEGIYVQKMHQGGVELLVSAFRDPLFGPIVSCGSGGGLTEMIDDVVTERAPVGSALAADMLERLGLRRHARDPKGPLPSEAAAAFISRFSELAATAPWPRFVFEVNPILWSREGVVAVDGLLIVEAR